MRRHARSRSLAGCASLLAMLAAPAPAARAQSLDEASQAALDTSYLLKGDHERQVGAQQRLRGSMDSFMPTVTVLADRPLHSTVTYAPDILPTSIGLGGADDTPRHAPSQLGIVATLPLFDGLKRYNVLQSSRVQFEAGKSLTEVQRQKVLLDVALAYLAVLRDARIIAFRQAQIAATTRISEIVDRQFATNDATRTDVALARSRVQEAMAALDRARAEAAASRLEFKRLTKMEPERMAPPRQPDVLPADENAYARLVRDRNPTLTAARLDVTSAGYLADAAKSELSPTLDFQVSRSTQYGYSAALDRITDTTARLTARIPIYEPGAFPRIGEAAAAARQRGYEAQDAELSALTAARTAFERHLATGIEAERLRKRAEDLRATARGYGIERGAGFRTILDVLNIQGELADAEISAVLAGMEHDGLTFQLAAQAALLGTGRGKALAALPDPVDPLPRPVARVLGAIRPTLLPRSDIASLDAPPRLRGSVPSGPGQ